MNIDRQLELIDKQITDARDGFPEDFGDWHNTTEVVIRSVFGENSPTHRKFTDVSYSPRTRVSGQDTSGFRPRGVRDVIAILTSAKLELQLAASSGEAPLRAYGAANSQRTFIIHGRNDGRKYELESFLQKLVADPPIILHQEANGGRVIIEKLEDNAAAAGYAVALLTADDVGRPVTSPSAEDRLRARQNVVFEVGFFVGLLGRSRVAILYDEDVELPSDLHGLVYILLDASGGWKAQLAKEVDNAGISIDWSAVGRV